MYVYRGPEARLASHSLGESVIRNVRYAAGDLKLGDWNRARERESVSQSVRSLYDIAIEIGTRRPGKGKGQI